MKPLIHPEDFIPTAANQFIGGANTVAKILEGKAARLSKSESGCAKLLLYGTPGCGKTRLAEFFARKLTCHPLQIESTNGRNVTVEVIRQWQQAGRYLNVFGKWSVKIVNELDTCPAAAQDLLLSYLDELPPCNAFIGTSNLDLRLLVERFQTRLQQFKVTAPDTDELNALLAQWKLPKQFINEIAVGCGGNVRAALLDAQSILDAK